MNLKLELLSPEKIGFSSESVFSVAIPGYEGEFEVLFGHVDTISVIKTGLVKIKEKEEDEGVEILVFVGVVNITNQSVYILVDEFFIFKDLKQPELESMLKEAEEKLDLVSLEDKESVYQKITFLKKLIATRF